MSQSHPLPPPPPVDDSRPEPRALLALAQGMFYVGSGIWPLFSLRTFQKVTGPKTDLWLVQTVGALVTVIGVTLVASGMRKRVTPEIEMLAVGSAASLGAIDLYFTSKKRIAPLYLFDAAAEIALIACWLAAKDQDSQQTE